MKKTTWMAAVAVAVLPTLVVAESVDLSVTGTIIPTSCVPAFAGGGTVDLRKISAATLNKTTQTLLPTHNISLHINCDAPAPVEVSVRDNRAATKLPGISDGAGQSDPVLFYGLGEINGTRIGGFALRHGTPETDGTGRALLTRTLAAPAWRSTRRYVGQQCTCALLLGHQRGGWPGCRQAPWFPDAAVADHRPKQRFADR